MNACDPSLLDVLEDSMLVIMAWEGAKMALCAIVRALRSG
jgi:hypothetical protein